MLKWATGFSHYKLDIVVDELNLQIVRQLQHANGLTPLNHLSRRCEYDYGLRRMR